ncbi:MAG: transposase [Janthinobacterium lividum]
MLLEIKGLGHTGSLSQLNRLLTEWRRTGRPTATAEATASPLLDPATGHLVSPIAAAALCVKPRGMLTTKQAVTVDAFKASSTDFAAMRALAMRFRALLRDGDVKKLTTWLHDARHSTLFEIRRFAQTLTLDLAAVRNAITERWSNGQVEGQITRLKMLKRAMNGRAGVDLLRARLMPFKPETNHSK